MAGTRTLRRGTDRWSSSAPQHPSVRWRLSPAAVVPFPVPLTFPPCGGAGLSSPLSPTLEPPAGLPSGELQKDQGRVLPPSSPPDSGDGSQPCPCVCWLVVAVTLVDVHAAQMPQEARVKVWGQVLACEKTGHPRLCLDQNGASSSGKQKGRREERQGRGRQLQPVGVAGRPRWLLPTGAYSWPCLLGRRPRPPVRGCGKSV